MRYPRAFGAFWWGFVVGEDWRVAVGIAAGLGLTTALTDHGWSAWWLMPIAVAVLLVRSLRRAASRPCGRATSPLERGRW